MKTPNEIIQHLEDVFSDANWQQVLGLIPELEEVQKEIQEFRAVGAD